MEALATSSVKLLMESGTRSSRPRPLSSSSSSSSSSSRFSKAPATIFVSNWSSSSSSSRGGAAAIRFFQPHRLRFRSLHRADSVSSESQAGAAEDSIHLTNQSSTVRVKFKLHKECLFGEQFFLVGDDVTFGVWDPENAIPLEWSDGHVWMAELDIPTGKSIQFKFILKGATGEIVWQPGPDRVLQTWETKNLIVISEDWENAETQKITEEELVVTPNSNLFIEEDTSYSQEKSIGNTNNRSVVAGNITYPKDELMADSKNTQENISFLRKETRTDNEPTISEDKPYSDGTTEEEEEEASVVESSHGSNGSLATEKNQKRELNMGTKRAFNVPDYDGEPVLVPGLNPFPTPTLGFSEPERSIIGASIGDDEAESPDVPEKPEKPETNAKLANQHEEGKSVTVSDEGTKEEGNAFVAGLKETHLTKEQEQPNQQTSDIQWGRKILRRFLANLGLL